MSTPLNPTLHRNLLRVFGSVRYSNEGLAMISRYAYNTLKGHDELVVDSAGEHYLVNCDRCGDTRHRLQINHRFAVRDIRGRRNLHLAICFNEDCYADYETRLDLVDRLSEIDGVLEHARILPGKEVTEARTVELPGPVFRLDTLPPEHPANRYLAGRFFDPERLGRFYRVGYCPSSFYFLAKHRIIIPIYEQQELKGWQARYIGDLDWHGPNKKELPPKYFSCPGMDRKTLLYNLANARKYRTTVVMEGPPDVWSLGPMGVATFGFPMTYQQLKVLVAAMKTTGKKNSNRSVVFLFDPDVLLKTRTKAAYEKLRAHIDTERPFGDAGVAWINPPGGYDPGELDRRFLQEFIVREAAKQDVKISWELAA